MAKVRYPNITVVIPERHITNQFYIVGKVVCALDDGGASKLFRNRFVSLCKENKAIDVAPEWVNLIIGE